MTQPKSMGCMTVYPVKQLQKLKPKGKEYSSILNRYLLGVVSIQGFWEQHGLTKSANLIIELLKQYLRIVSSLISLSPSVLSSTEWTQHLQIKLLKTVLATLG